MRQADILDMLQRSGRPMTCSEMLEEAHINMPSSSISRRMHQLEKYGFVRKVGVITGRRGQPTVLWEAIS